jgi:ABC-2 type transport system ATP-binding protein
MIFTSTQNLTEARPPAAPPGPDGGGDLPAIRTAALAKSYGQRLAVAPLDIEIPRAAVTGLVGPNGAGKTTIMRMLLGLIAPSSGTAEILGVPLGPGMRHLAAVGALIEGPAFYPSLTGRANLRVLAELSGSDLDSIGSALDLLGLAGVAGDAVRTYSLGMRQRLAIAAALLGQPELVILDEPANGLDPAGIRELRALLRRLAGAGVAVLVSSHQLAEIELCCDHLAVLSAGRLLFHGPMNAFLARRASYLLARPADPARRDAVADLCRRAGHSADVGPSGVEVHAPATWAPELHRLCAGAGLWLVELRHELDSLEDTFLSLITDPLLITDPGDASC